MLNISENNNICDLTKDNDFKAIKLIKKGKAKKLILRMITFLAGVFFLSLFLPWTQNIKANGYVTTRSPQERPQTIQSVIPGRIVKWYIQEGDHVKKGDTIAQLAEIKSEYFDQNLIERTNEQVQAKEQSAESYQQKVSALDDQYLALKEGFELKKAQLVNKLEQTNNKIKIDSIDLIAHENNLYIVTNQLERTKSLYEKGLKSLTQLQEKEYKVQSSTAKVAAQKNKLLNQRNNLSNLKLEQLRVEQEYADKIAKSRSNKQSAISARLESVAAASKLKNKLSNYEERKTHYFITAPQNGFLTKTVKKGIGEIVKEGSKVATIMPDNYELAIDVYLKPQDLPLLELGDKARLRFDGWPAIIISGWPETSTGIFTGEIVAIDRFINDDGYYRVLISPDQNEKKWPKKLRVGTGVNAFLLLNDVPIWYEIWRQLNGFPPDFYKTKDNKNIKIKRKAPLKSVK